MTTQHQVIAFCVIGIIAVPLGVFTTIKLINKLMRPPVNSLVRSTDIELVDYIEPTRPQEIYNYPDLLESHDRIPYYIERISDYGRLPSYWSGTPPSYHTLDRWYISSWSENSINLDFWIYLMLFCVFLLIIRKLISNKLDINNLIIIILLFLGTVYIQFGLLVLFQIILWIIVFFLSNFLLGINPDNTQFKVIRAMAIIVIIFIINSLIFNNSLYSISILIPFSTFDIDFRDSFEWKLNSYRFKPIISYLKLQKLSEDINLLLLSLEDDENYSMSLSYISSYKLWKDNKEKVHPLFIDDAIIVNKESDPILITEFIMDRLNDKGLFETNSLFNDSLINSMDPVILTVSVRIKVII